MAHNHTSSPWINRWRYKPQARLRLFCFPYAGGGASIFRFLSEQAPAEIEICPVQLPGRENRLSEPAFFSLDLLLATLLKILSPYFDIPYAFFGHSMGALISFELARSLRQIRQIRKPGHLFVSGHRAPHLSDPRPPAHLLPDPQLIETLRRLHGTPEDVLEHGELLQLLLPLLRADFTLCETYNYRLEPPLSCPISALGGLQDQEVPHESILAWRQHTSDSFQTHFFPGNHFFLNTEQKALSTVLFHDIYNNLMKERL